MALLRLIVTFLFLASSSSVVAGVGGGAAATSSSGQPHDGLLRDLQSATTNGTCPVLCANGTAMTGGNSSLPIFSNGPQTCSSVEALLAANDETTCKVIATYLNFLDLGAYCMCEGSSPPNKCTTCSGGGSIQEPDKEFTVPFLNGVSFSCRQGAAFVSYVTSDFACTGFTGTFRM
jgi:hypothetical protein